MNVWTWALAAYARPDVEQACLDLQDGHRQSVPYLLWAAWAAQNGRALTEAMLERGAALALQWEQATVAPLRLARKGLASALEGVADQERENLRTQVKALELRAEDMAMRGLEQIAPERAGGVLPLEPALASAARAWAFPAPEAALRRLAHALG